MFSVIVIPDEGGSGQPIFWREVEPEGGGSGGLRTSKACEGRRPLAERDSRGGRSGLNLGARDLSGLGRAVAGARSTRSTVDNGSSPERNGHVEPGVGRSTESVHVEVVAEGRLSLDRAVDWVECPRSGAIATFSGVVRDNSDGRQVDHLDYEAYVPMAVKVMRSIGERIVKERGVSKIFMAHRVGRLQVKGSPPSSSL